MTLLMGRRTSAGNAETADFRRKLALAQRHGLEALLHRRLQDASPPEPASDGGRLRRPYLAAAAANMRLFHELGRILRAAGSADLPIIPLKGACLAEIVYGDIALRPMADIDLLVKPADLPRAIDTLRRLGYESDQPFDPAAQQAGFQDMPPMMRAGCVPVELHWTLVTPLCGARINEDERQGIWERSAPATIAGVPSRMLSPEDLLLHLCMHASVHHRFADVGLRAFVDIAEVVRHYEGALDWMAFTGRANRWGVANGVRAALMLGLEWTDLVVPSGVWARLEGDAPADDVLAWARHKVLDGGPIVLTSEFARLESAASASRKLSVLWRSAFPPRAAMARQYGVRGDSWRVLACYPYRFRDLWKRYSRALWKLLRRDGEFVRETRQEARLRDYLGWP